MQATTNALCSPSSSSPSSPWPSQSYNFVPFWLCSDPACYQDLVASSNWGLCWSLQCLQHLHHHLRLSLTRLLHSRHESSWPIGGFTCLHRIDVWKRSQRYLLFHSAFGKSRSFQLDDADQCQTFEVVFPFEIRQAFQVKYKSRFNQKLAGKAYNTSIISNPIPEMLNEEDYKDL